MLSLAFAVAPAAVFADPADALFEDNREHEVFLTVDPSDWAQIRRDYLLNTYYPARLVLEGQELPRVGIRSRGSGSRSPEKPNFLIAFDRYDKGQSVLGLSAVVLKANNQDPSMLREVLAMKLLRLMGVPAPREAPARLYINDEYFGAYTLVERIDAAFLRSRFGEDNGYLYEWQAMRTEQGYRFEYLGSDPASYSPVLWSPSNHESDNDPTPIVELVDLINNSGRDEFVNRLGEYLDVSELVTYIAAENFVADYDGLLGTVFGMNNFYFYRFDGTKRSTFIAWDKDASFDWEYKPIFEGVFENVLTRRMMAQSDWREQYLRTLSRNADSAGGGNGWLAQELERLYGMIGESARSDVHKQCTVDGVMRGCGPEDFEAAVEHLRQVVARRADFVNGEIRKAGLPVSEPGVTR